MLFKISPIFNQLVHPDLSGRKHIKNENGNTDIVRHPHRKVDQSYYWLNLFQDLYNREVKKNIVIAIQGTTRSNLLKDRHRGKRENHKALKNK